MEAKIAKKGPYVQEEQPGDKWWCACGHSASQPFCDGAHTHMKTEMTPVKVTIPEAKTVAWCGCKRSGKPPFCDGAHAKL